jgi:hypothetical protein
VFQFDAKQLEFLNLECAHCLAALSFYLSSEPIENIDSGASQREITAGWGWVRACCLLDKTLPAFYDNATDSPYAARGHIDKTLPRSLVCAMQ